MSWTNPRTWVAGEKPTAATMNTHIRDNLKAIGDAWTSYGTSTTLWKGSTTDPVIGNGTLSGKYAQAGKLTFFRIELTMGSTTTYGSGNYVFLLPATPIAFTEGIIGQALLFDSSGSARTLALGRHNGSGSLNLIRTDTGALVTAAAPYAWATSDKISISGSYEAA